MGTPTPPPPVVGENCDACPGTLWPVGSTPKFIHLTAAGLENCPAADYPPPNGVFVLQQVDGQPCVWLYDVFPYKWSVHLVDVGFVEGMMKRDAGGYQFTFLKDGTFCLSVFDNDYVACGGNFCKNGTVSIVWS